MADASSRARPPRGLYLVVAGPDGTGKSTVVGQLRAQAADKRPILQLHHRPMVLGGRRRSDGPVTDPHREAPYPRWLSLVKLVFVYLDHLAGWWITLRPHLCRGGDVILERGWWDLLVDPRRYRLQAHPNAVRLLGRLLPRPDRTLLLGGDARVIAARKEELSVQETVRQLEAWRSVPAGWHRCSEIDTTLPHVETHGQVTAAVAVARRGRRWLALPRGPHPRWWLPATSGRVLAAALHVHQPVTPRGRVGWWLAVALARTGGGWFAARRGASPPAEVLAAVDPHLPPGHQVAVAHGRHAGRSTVLSLDPRTGALGVFGKVALDPGGAGALAHEAAALRAAADTFSGRVRVPRVVASDDRSLVIEAVRGRPRARPWVLPDEVAAALGAHHRFGRRPDGSGPCHGDLAPWNLLTTPTGWCVVDWADARPDAPPFEDVLHHVVQSHALLGNPDTGQVLAAFDGRGPCASAFRAYAEAAGCDLREVRPRAIEYLRRSLTWLDLDAEDGRRGHRARVRLLEVLT